MSKNEYLQWLSGNTATSWWHDSAIPEEIADGIVNGAVGVTTNPVLINSALYQQQKPWDHVLHGIPKAISPDEKTEEIAFGIPCRT